MYAKTCNPATVTSSNRLFPAETDAPVGHPADTLQCRCCGAEIRRVESQVVFCPECHVVQDDRPLSRTPRPHYGENERKRTGSRVTNLWADQGLGTGVGTSNTDSNGNTLSRSQRRVTRKRGWTNRRTSSEYRLDYAFGEIRRMGATFAVPEPELEEAARLYRNARAAGCVQGRSVEGFVTACLLAAIRRSTRMIPVSGQELRTVTRADEEQIRVAREALSVELDVEIPPLRPKAFLPKAASELAIPGHVERRVRTVLAAYTAGDGAYRGHSPRTLAAAAVHAAYDLTSWGKRPTLESLSNVFGTSESTISAKKGELLEAIETDA
jgi:transcription initiation factor TFIIB